MEIKQEQNESKGVFYVEEEGKRLAELEYSIANNNLMIISHTEVDEILKGKLVHLPSPKTLSSSVSISPSITHVIF